MKIDHIQIEQIADQVWGFEDKNHNSFYLIEGSQKAIVIDTGMSKESIVPIIQKLTNKPLELVLTHAHIDHMFHCDEFKDIYLHRDDIKAWKGSLGVSMWLAAKFMFHVPAKHYHVSQYHPLVDGDEISLGDNSLHIIRCAGHTPGSIVIVDDKHKLIFSGDAFGSGGGVFMWTPASLPLSIYQQELNKLLLQLRGKENYLFLGGHRNQGKPYSKKDDAYTLNIQVIQDVISLCDMILKSKIKPMKNIHLYFFHILWFSYKHAGIAILKKGIK